MSSFQVVDTSPGSSVSVMETSNFAHVIFQNVGKSFLPQAPLECCYTLTPYITPHPKDWVGIFKVGWSTARDYYTFLWSPMPENYEPGSTVHRTVVFQGYYVPKSDGEFYQFCYVTHTGDIRGASTPFQFRSATPTEELLTVTEDDSNSDILVVTTKTGLLERVEEAQQERRELLKAMRLLQEEKQQLQEEQKRLAREREQERETCCLLRTHNQVRERRTAAICTCVCGAGSSPVITGAAALVAGAVRREGGGEEEADRGHGQGPPAGGGPAGSHPERPTKGDGARLAELARVREQLRQAEEQLQASRQQASLLASELRDSASARDHTMTELYRARLEADKLRASLADAQAECQRMESQLDRMRSTAQKEVGVGTGGEVTPSMMVVSEAEAELQREVEELKLRLHMAAEHYKEKYRECQRLRRQVAKLNTTESQGEPKRNASTETTLEPLTPSPESPTAGNIATAVLQEAAEMTIIPELNNREFTHTDAHTSTEKEEKQRESAPVESSEAEAEREVNQGEDGKIKEKEEKRESLREESLKMTSWVEVENERQGVGENGEAEGVQMAERASEVTELKRNLAQALRDKEQLQEELQRYASRQREQEAGVQGAEVRQPMVLRYPLPYPQDPSPPPLVPQRPAELQYGNPYSTDTTKERVDVALSPEHMSRPPPEAPPCAPPCAPPITPPSPGPGAPGWEREVVCIQPSRTTSPPESLDQSPEEPRNSSRETKITRAERVISSDVHKRCPLCEVIFPPHFEQRSFEQHVESHWKVCPVCSEQFPLNCQQQLFERHVLTHFDGHVLNFEQTD
eukprot:superscaffoldBa00001065_g8778